MLPQSERKEKNTPVLLPAPPAAKQPFLWSETLNLAGYLTKIGEVTYFLPMFRLWDDRTRWLFACILLQRGNPSFSRSTSSHLPDHKAMVFCFTGKQTHALQANTSVWLVYDFWEALVGALQRFSHSPPHTGGAALLLCHGSAYGL